MPPSHPHPPPSSGSKGGAVVRALASHQCGPGSNPGVDGTCGLSLLLVLSLAPRGFSPSTPVFPSPQKPTFPNSNSTRNQVNEEPLCGCATCKSLFIYLFNFEVCMMFDTWTYSRTSIQRRAKGLVKFACYTEVSWLYLGSFSHILLLLG